MTQDMIYTFRGHLKWMCILLLGGMLYKCQLGATDEFYSASWGEQRVS